MDISFSINEYDHEGDIVEKGIYIHFNNTRIKVADTIEEYEEFVNELKNITNELSDSYKIRL